MSYKLPKEYENSNKDVVGLLRKLSKNENVEQQFKDLCYLENIEEYIFGRIIARNQTHFVLRLYVKSNVLKTFGDKLLGKFASWTQEVGASHLGVQIADTIVHWFNSSFALPKEWKGGGATALFYPQDREGLEVPVIENTKENRMAVCKVIQMWNCQKIYSQRNANCQLFAADIFKALGLNQNFSKWEGPVGDFLKYAGEYENQTKEIYPCIIKSGNVYIQWKSHEELDNWHNDNLDTYEDYASLLKAFHRAYQLRQDIGFNCPQDAPTLLINKFGEKEHVVEHCAYSHPSDSKVSGLSSPNSGQGEEGEKGKRNFSKEFNTEKIDNNVKDTFDKLTKEKEEMIEKVGEIIKLPSPNLKPEDPKNVKECPGCESSFGFFTKTKKNCDACKKVYCSSCCFQKIVLPEEYGYNSFSNRINGIVCEECYAIIILYNKKQKKKDKK
eukprot:TRINITY_DN12064_c0_g1_i1.p1 TRINITY_DN12064_c0_g1~~TRINITY_DN12064_c0_g1_i1.p1  ORF type:complete len:442 (-),score=112.95 TRINITY_DN12064_c0_g1_i1:107-1432(-)